jgi:predicted nucleotidyltransferase
MCKAANEKWPISADAREAICRGHAAAYLELAPTPPPKRALGSCVMEKRNREFEALVTTAKAHAGVVAVFVLGSRGRPDGMADAQSDYDVAVIASDDDALRTVDEMWPYRHGALVEVMTATVAQLREHGEYGSRTEWARPQYARVNIVFDKTGEVTAILAEKALVPQAHRERVVRDGLDGFINATYRALRYATVGAGIGARLDAAESLPWLLNAVFAIDGRVRPFNKYVATELASYPLSDRAFHADVLVPRLAAILNGSSDEQHALFRDVERVARAHGWDDAVDSWEPDVAWLRGDAPYRSA